MMLFFRYGIAEKSGLIYRGKEKAMVIFSAFNLAFPLKMISKPWSRVVGSKERPLIAFSQRNMM